MAIKKEGGGGLSAAEKAKRKAAEEAAKKQKKADDDAADAARAKKAAAAKKKAPVVSKPIATPAPPRGGPGAKTGAEDAPKPIANPVITPKPPRGGPGAKVGTEDGPRPVTPTPTTPTTPTPPSGGGGGGRDGGFTPPPTEPAPEEPTPEEPTPEEPTPGETAAEKVKREADEAAAKADAAKTATNRQLFRLIMGSYFNLSKEGSWIDSLFDNAKKFYDQNITGDTVVELLLREENAPKPFTDRFRLYLDKDTADVAAGKSPRFGSIATFLATEKAIGEKLSSYGTTFQKLNTQENINKFISGDVSADEVGSRIDNAYYAVNTADAALKEQIKGYFPSLNDDDLALSLVTGGTDSIQQKIKFGAAGIAASAKLAGIQSQSDLEDLAKQGVTREESLKGFQQVARERTGIQQAARTFGTQAPTQKELESEALLKTESATARQLRSQTRAQFGGQAGIVRGSLGRKKQV